MWVRSASGGPPPNVYSSMSTASKVSPCVAGERLELAVGVAHKEAPYHRQKSLGILLGSAAGGLVIIAILVRFPLRWPSH